MNVLFFSALGLFVVLDGWSWWHWREICGQGEAGPFLVAVLIVWTLILLGMLLSLGWALLEPEADELTEGPEAEE